MTLVALQRGDRVTTASPGLRKRLFVVRDRFGRMLLVSGSIPLICEHINTTFHDPIDQVQHQCMYNVANGKTKRGFHKSWACEELDLETGEARINALLGERRWAHMGILTDAPERWTIARADAREDAGVKRKKKRDRAAGVGKGGGGVGAHSTGCATLQAGGCSGTAHRAEPGGE